MALSDLSDRGLAWLDTPFLCLWGVLSPLPVMAGVGLPPLHHEEVSLWNTPPPDTHRNSPWRENGKKNEAIPRAGVCTDGGDHCPCQGLISPDLHPLPIPSIPKTHISWPLPGTWPLLQVLPLLLDWAESPGAWQACRYWAGWEGCSAAGVRGGPSPSCSRPEPASLHLCQHPAPGGGGHR